MKPARLFRLAPMILSAALAASAAAGPPDPVYFRIQMELGDIDRARAWLDAGLDPDTMGDAIGSGLMIAAGEGNIPLMELFLARGAAIDKTNGAGETALMLAAWKGHAEAVQWLLDHGARVNQDGMRWSALHYAVFSGHRELARRLVERGADINARSANGSSVLMMAIYEGHDDLAQWLVDKGADVSPRNDWGDGALEWSMKFGRTKIARLITDAASFAAAASVPKAQWGEAKRSLAAVEPPPPADSEELQRLLRLREFVAERRLDVGKLDRRIAAERARIYRAGIATSALPPAAPTTRLEITARRAAPEDQDARLVVDQP